MRIFTNNDGILVLGVLLSLVVPLIGCSSGSNSSSSNDGSGTGNEVPGSVSTPLPGSGDEPITEEAVFNTAIGFAVTREPGPRLPEEDDQVELSDADFNLGLPTAVVEVPDGLDVQVNRPPFFDGLQNIEVQAGTPVEIVYRPQDPDGQLPGMFPEKLPQGGSFDDNFDGSKTFRWLPLQMDVGILKFTVTAVDADDSRLRVSQPVLIRVSLPPDPSTIPNVAPMLDVFRAHTVRVGDPVVIELKGIDLNGSVPTLEIPSLPAGATFNRDPRFEEIYVLKLVPDTAGELTVQVLARDSVDTSLIRTESVTVTVLPRSDFERAGTPLKTLAANRNVQIGFAALQSFYHRPDGAIYADTAAREFSIVTPENSMKMDYMNPEPGRYQFAATDNLVAFAQSNDMVVHGHPLIWYRQVPAWIERAAVSARERHMTDFITRIMSRYTGAITIWDVVNEPMADDGDLRTSVWFDAMGESYIDTALRTARNAAPDGTLLINEFDIYMSGSKFDGLMALTDRLQSREVPLDGIGFQMHLFSSFDQFDALRSNFSAVAARNLDIYITELDVSLNADDSLTQQASVYRQIMTICLEQPRCKAVQTWGFTDQYSFRSIYDPLPFDRDYQPKPAYDALAEALSR